MIIEPKELFMNLKKICAHACIYYTASTFFLLILYMILSKDTSSGFSTLALVSLLPFSFLFSFANLNFKYSEMKITWRVLIHFLLTVGSIFVFLYLPNREDDATAAQGFILALALIIIYWIVMSVILVFRARAELVKRDTKQYQSLYRGKKDASHDKPKKKNKDEYQSVYKKK